MPQPLTRDLVLDFVLESVLGTPAELWLGKADESPFERAARLDAAVDVLADDPNAPGAGFLSGLLIEDVLRPVEFVAPGDPDGGDEDVEWLEAA